MSAPSPKFAAGERCYLLGGRECIYVAETADGHVVRRVIEIERGDGEIAEVEADLEHAPAWSACCSWAQSKGASEALTIPDDLATCVRERSLKSALEDLGRAEAEVEKKRAVVAAPRGTA